jgi:predicted ribosome quality control (RQC) complex YloA/Tae2 family protein
MKKSLTSPDIRELVLGWQSLIGSRLDQFGRPDSNKLIFKLRNKEKGTIRLVLDLDGWAYLTKESITTESNQGVFVNQVRQKIKKSRLEAITQLNGDRVIAFDFARKDEKIKLILEFFHKGNAILCNGNQIERVMRQQKFRHRKLAPNESYIFPPGFNPFTSSLEEYRERLENSERSLGAGLTIDCNLGGEISSLICHKLALDSKSEVLESKIGLIYSEIEKILIDKNEPTIYVDENNENITVSLFNLTNLTPSAKFTSFDNAIEDYVKSVKKPEVVVKDKEDVRISRQKEAIKKYLQEAQKFREIGDLIFSNIGNVEKSISNEEDDEITINLEGHEIKILISKSAQANGSIYFDKAKECERKAERTKQIIKEKPKKSSQKKVRAKKIEWFEKYRWFITSEGDIALGGKDATTNEQVVKKYLKNNDRYAHADIHGAPSIVVKSSQGVPPSENAMKQASSFSLAYSKAWGARVASGHSFWVDNDKVSKTPNTGEFLAKGAFVIRGKRNWNRNLEVNISIGIIEYDGIEKLMGGPVESFQGKSKKYLSFKPGFVDRKIVSRKLAKAFNEDLPTVERLLPSGGFELIDSYGIEIKLE